MLSPPTKDVFFDNTMETLVLFSFFLHYHGNTKQQQTLSSLPYILPLLCFGFVFCFLHITKHKTTTLKYYHPFLLFVYCCFASFLAQHREAQNRGGFSLPISYHSYGPFWFFVVRPGRSLSWQIKQFVFPDKFIFTRVALYCNWFNHRYIFQEHL